MSTLGSEEVNGGVVDEFSAIIGLKTFDGEAELCCGKGSKLD